MSDSYSIYLKINEHYFIYYLSETIIQYLLNCSCLYQNIIEVLSIYKHFDF